MVTSQTVGPVHGMGIEASELGVPLRPGNEEGKELIKGIEPTEVQVAAIHDIEGSRLGHQEIEDIDVMEPSLCNFDERGYIPMKVQERMHLDRGFMFAERRPGKEGQAQVDCGGIESVGGSIEFDTEFFIGIQGSCLGDQNLAEVGVHSPVTFLIRLGQSAPRYPASYAEMVELLSAGPKAGFNIPEAFPVGQLSEGHAEILIHAGKAACMIIAPVTVNAFAKFIHRQIVHDLRKDRFPEIH